jgi:hypothetical protein
MPERRSLTVRLSISADRFLAYYRLDAQEVIASTADGTRVRFPASALRPHVTRDGIHGLFEIQFGDDHKLIAVKRIGD